MVHDLLTIADQLAHMLADLRDSNPRTREEWSAIGELGVASRAVLSAAVWLESLDSA